jgi:hypothetical protein
MPDDKYGVMRTCDMRPNFTGVQLAAYPIKSADKILHGETPLL